MKNGNHKFSKLEQELINAIPSNKFLATKMDGKSAQVMGYRRRKMPKAVKASKANNTQLYEAVYENIVNKHKYNGIAQASAKPIASTPSAKSATNGVHILVNNTQLMVREGDRLTLRDNKLFIMKELEIG